MQKKTDIVTLNNVPVQVDSYGGVTPLDIEENPENKPKELILLVPGNPGVCAFYDDFVEDLHGKTKKPVWVVSHSGHSSIIKHGPPLQGNEELYNLSAQVKQKKELIEKYLKNVKLYLIGHSIGCYMILEALQNIDTQIKVEKCYFLFPTIERMAESPNGKRFIFAYKYLLWLLLSGTYIFENLPNFLQVMLIKIYYWICGITNSKIQAVSDLLHYNVVKCSLFLADDEMKLVRELNHQAVDNIGTKLKLYYGSTDGWVPLSYFKDFKKSHNNVYAEVCILKIEHAFVLRQSLLMAELVRDWLAK